MFLNVPAKKPPYVESSQLCVAAPETTPAWSATSNGKEAQRIPGSVSYS